jgi:hypothetical protein
MVNESLRTALADLANGVETNVIATRLVECEWEAFSKRQRIAGEIAFARQRLLSGDRDAAIALLRALVEGKRS